MNNNGYGPSRHMTDEEKEIFEELDPNGLIAKTAEDFMQMEFPPREFIMEPIFQTQGTMMVYSKRGVGKTYLSLGFGLAIAAGIPFLKWTVPKPRKVLYVDGEMPAVTMQQRMRIILGGMSKPTEPGFFRLITPDLQFRGIPSLFGTIGQSMIEDRLHDTEVLILDNLSTLFRGGKENDTDSWTPAQEWVLSLRRQGISVLIDHHAGKNGGQRGTSGHEDILDTVLNLRQPSDYTPDQGARFEVHFEKARNVYGNQLDSFGVTLRCDSPNAATWLISDTRLELEAKIKEMLALGMSIREIAEELGMAKSTLHRIKAKMAGTL